MPENALSTISSTVTALAMFSLISSELYLVECDLLFFAQLHSCTVTACLLICRPWPRPPGTQSRDFVCNTSSYCFCTVTASPSLFFAIALHSLSIDSPSVWPSPFFSILWSFSLCFCCAVDQLKAIILSSQSHNSSLFLWCHLYMKQF